MRRAMLITVLACLHAAGARAVCWTVEQDGSGDFTTIQAAIDAAAAGDSIMVGDGVWTGPGNKNLDFNGADVVTLLSRNGPASCTIDCQNDGRAFYFHSGEGRDVEVRGLTIANGLVADSNVGGIYCDGSVVVTDCVVDDNFALQGAGVYADGGLPDLFNCLLDGNEAAEGGAVFSHGATVGLDCCTPDIRGSTFASSGSGSALAGAFYCWNGSAVVLTDCIIAHSSTGAAVHCGGDAPYPVLSCCDLCTATRAGTGRAASRIRPGWRATWARIRSSATWRRAT
jgi:hypothetical protein